MGEMSQEYEGQDQGYSSQGEGTGGINPAWNDLLGYIPEDVHSQVTPILQQWDQNYQNGIQKVHSQYEGYKPYLENGIGGDQINYALQLLDAVESRPEEVMQAMQEYLMQDGGEEPEYEQQGQDNDTGYDLSSNPEFQQLNQVVQQIAELMVQDNQSQQEAEEDAELDEEFEQLHQQYGDFDETWVMSQMLADPEQELSDVVEAYGEFVNGIRSGAMRPGPKVLGQGGNFLPQGVQPKNLDGKGRRSLIMDMLNQANQQNE